MSSAGGILAGAQAPGVMSRAQIVELGQAGNPWAFLSIGAMALRQAPQDHAIRFLMAVNLARLGLRTLAGEQLELLPPQARENESVQQLGSALSGLPMDSIGMADRERHCRDGVLALADRGVNLREAFSVWRARIAHRDYFRTLDGNLIWRERARVEPDKWGGLAESKAASAASIADVGLGAEPSPVVVEGVLTPWLLDTAWRATAADSLGYSPRLYVVQRDPDELLEGLSLMDLSPLLRDPRVEVLVGDHAAQDLVNLLQSRFELQLPRLVLRAPQLLTPINPAPGVILQQALREQAGEHERLKARVARLGLGRRDGPPRRVLIPTSRLTTFVQHSADDLADAFTESGARTVVLKEPDCHSRLSSIAYLRAMEGLEPDLVVLINYTRGSFPGLYPLELPIATWVQDAMPHLLSKGAGAGLGPHDVVLGYRAPELVTALGYPADRTAPFPLVISTKKFHSGAVSGEHAAKLTCELAMISHHSETPEALHARLTGEAKEPAIQRAMERLHPLARRIGLDPLTPDAKKHFFAEAQSALAEALGRPAERELVGRIVNSYLTVVADRYLRHQMLGWAADAAEQRGWRLHVYGNGWGKHKRFARYARPALTHGEELRAAYRCAAVTLHGAYHGFVHQRVLECAASGGLPVCRLCWSGLSPLMAWARVAAARLGRERSVEPLRAEYSVADSWELMLATSTLQRLGLSTTPLVNDRGCAEVAAATMAVRDIDGPAGWLVARLAETVFRSRDELEAVTQRALEGDHWRSAVAEFIAGPVRRHLTYAQAVSLIADLLKRDPHRHSVGAGALSAA